MSNMEVEALESHLPVNVCFRWLLVYSQFLHLIWRVYGLWQFFMASRKIYSGREMGYISSSTEKDTTFL